MRGSGDGLLWSSRSMIPVTYSNPRSATLPFNIDYLAKQRDESRADILLGAMSLNPVQLSARSTSAPLAPLHLPIPPTVHNAKQSSLRQWVLDGLTKSQKEKRDNERGSVLRLLAYCTSRSRDMKPTRGVRWEVAARGYTMMDTLRIEMDKAKLRKAYGKPS